MGVKLRRLTRAIWQSFRRMSSLADKVWSGTWWWSIRFWFADRTLERVLKHHGEKSLEASRYTQLCRELYFGVRYWRPAPPLVRNAIETAERAGVSRADLRLLALNRDVRQLGDTIHVRHSWWMPLFAYTAPVVYFSNWAYLMAFALLSPGSWLAKTTAALVITSLYWVMWPGFSLYSTRAYVAVKRSGAMVEKVGQVKEGTAQLHTLSSKART